MRPFQHDHISLSEPLRARTPSSSAATVESRLAEDATRDVAGLSAPTLRPHRPKQAAVKLSILMPAYNEERTITDAIGQVLSADYPCDVELIVVDDGSSDRTPTLLERLDDSRVRVHSLPVNWGKGAAVLSASELAIGTYTLFDADLEYSRGDIPGMLEPVCAGRCSVVYGTRPRGWNTARRSYFYVTANRFLSRVANFLFNACVTDLHTCLKLMPLPFLKSRRLTEGRFGLDTEVTALLRLGVRPFEVEASYRGRSRAEGKKVALHDAMISAWILLRVRLLFRSRLIGPKQRQDVEGHTGGDAEDPKMRRVVPVNGHAVHRDGQEDEASAPAMG